MVTSWAQGSVQARSIVRSQRCATPVSGTLGSIPAYRAGVLSCRKQPSCEGNRPAKPVELEGSHFFKLELYRIVDFAQENWDNTKVGDG